MNWKELRPLLRLEFGNEFSFYNDLYKSGIRRIKIHTSTPNEMLAFIKTLSPELDTKLFIGDSAWSRSQKVTIHYR